MVQVVFNITNGGTGYTNPQILVSEPSYAGLGVTVFPRLGVGPTVDTGDGLLLDIVVGASNTVGVGSTFFNVNSFNIARNGYAFRKGDKFTPVGLVTDINLSNPISELQFRKCWKYSMIILEHGNLENSTLLTQSKITRMELELDSPSIMDLC